MKKYFKLTTITLLLLLFLLTSCGFKKVNNIDDRPDRYSMFTVVESTANWDIVYHRETKVMYAISNGSYNRGTFTLLVDEEGKPLLYGDN